MMMETDGAAAVCGKTLHLTDRHKESLNEPKSNLTHSQLVTI